VKKKHILFKIMVFLNVMLCSSVDGSNILEKPAASIFYPKNEGSRFFKKVGMLVSTYQIILHHVPEDCNVNATVRTSNTMHFVLLHLH
jgi:hypothetical protein